MIHMILGRNIGVVNEQRTGTEAILGKYPVDSSQNENVESVPMQPRSSVAVAETCFDTEGCRVYWR